MDASPKSELLKRDSVLAEIVRRLVDAYQPRRVYLFGSKARGDEGPDSDYDLLIVVADDAPADRRRRTGWRTNACGETVRPPTLWSAPNNISSRVCTWSLLCPPRSCGKENCSMPDDPELTAETRLG